jgi:hypothetical protein
MRRVTEFQPKTHLKNVRNNPIFKCEIDRSVPDPRYPILKLTLETIDTSDIVNTTYPLPDSKILSDSNWIVGYMQTLENILERITADTEDDAERVALKYTVSQLKKHIYDENLDGAILLFVGYLFFCWKASFENIF